MKTVIVILSIVCLAAPAWAWGPHGCPAPYYGGHACGYGYHGGCGCGYAAGVAAGAGLLALVAVALVAGAFRGGDGLAQAALESAARANQYECYLIALQHYSASCGRPVAPFSRAQWARWRASQGLEVIQ